MRSLTRKDSPSGQNAMQTGHSRKSLNSQHILEERLAQIVDYMVILHLDGEKNK